MKIGIMQPYFFPYVGYWQLIYLVDKYVIYDDVNYIKGGWINRNQILMNGKPKMINLKMNGASPNKLINEVQVAKDEIYNRKLLRTIEHCYKKAPELIISSNIDKNKSLKGQDKVINICTILNASEYYNAIGGVELYSPEVFESNGIKLKFLKTVNVEYDQNNDKFIPNLSIIDVMMFNSKEETKKLLNSYTIL